MKTACFFAILSAIGCLGLHAQNAAGTANTTATGQTGVPPPTAYQVVDQGGDYKVWQRQVFEPGPDGKIVSRVRSFKELATGLSYRQKTAGPWLDSKEEIDIQPDGSAVANQGQHKAYFPADISQGKIALTMPDGKILYSRPVGLSYDDGSNTVLIASLTNSTGYILNSNQVIYPNAFCGIRADLRLTYTKSGLEQDVLLRQQTPDPVLLHLNPGTARLQVLTEFFDPPQPAIDTTAVSTDAGDATDDRLDFGAMIMGRGRAFMMGDASPRVGVNKHWVVLEGRQFLVEEVPLASIAEQLAELPLGLNSPSRASGLYAASKTRILPKQPVLHASGHPRFELAQKPATSPAFVLDYQIVNGTSTNLIFQGDTTYYISGALSAYGTNIFEGGTVIKFANGATIEIVPRPGFLPAIVASGSAYRPIVFTAKDDNSVGNPISGSSGSPSGYYGTMLELAGFSGSSTLSGLRISYATVAIECLGVGLNLYNDQFVNCDYGFQVAGFPIKLRNALFANVQTNFLLEGGGVIDAQNTTFSGSSCIGQGASFYEGNYIALTNCILSNVSNVTNGVVGLSGGNNGFYQSPMFGGNSITNGSYPFQTVGAGNFYLTNGCSFMNAGTASIDPVLAANLTVRTTHPPIVFSNLTLAVVTNFSPQALRDTNAAPDLGYHYDPLDYIFGNVSVATNLSFSAGTAVGWFDSGGFGLMLNDGINVGYHGTATAPCIFALYSTVQEENDNAWTGYSWIWLGMAATGSAQDPNFSALIAPQFTHFYSLAQTHNFIRDYSAVLRMWADNSEFYSGAEAGYGVGLCFTNCLFDRMNLTAQAECCAQIFLQNCTMHGGILSDAHWGSWPTTITNCAFDGTTFSMDSSDTYCDHSAYVTNDAQLPIAGVHDVIVSNFNWQASWFGNYYLPPNSLLINAGSTTADQLGLYHFTTQTNQVPETNSVVDIGYHYVATDQYGNPLDSNGDGIPDYLEDANGNGLVDSGETNWAIAILTQPASQAVLRGGNVTMSVIAAGINPLVYQWYFNGTNAIPGATGSSLIISNVQLLQTGIYSVIVTNNYGSLTSSNAILTLSNTMVVGFGGDGVGQCDVPYGLTNACQVASGTGHSLALLNNETVVAWGWNPYGQATVPATLAGVAMVAAGWYHSVALLTNGTVTAWGFDEPTIGYPLTEVPPNLTNVIMISAQALHTLALQKNGIVAAWGYDTSFGETNVPIGLTNVTAIAAGYQFNLVVSNGTVVAWGDNTAGQCDVPVGLSNVVDVAAGINHGLALLQNSTVVAWGDDLDGEIDVPMGLSNVVAIAAGGDPTINAAYSMALKNDGMVVVWGDDDAVSPVGGLNHVIAMAAGTDNALAIRGGPFTPVITLEPVNEYQIQGGNAAFTARGSGLYGVTYQWQTNGVSIAGATNVTLALTNVQAAQVGNVYHVIVMDNDGMGSLTSSNANFYFVTPPIIVSQTLPASQVGIYNTNLTLNVVATAPGTTNGFPLTYQWQFNGTNISGATSASYTLRVRADSFGTYSVQISNAAGSTNTAWSVSVFYPNGLLITQQPTNQYQIAGGTINFYGGGVSSNAVTYQWLFDGANISGATNAILTMTNVQAAQQGGYNFILSDGFGSATSSNASFYLVTSPAIVSQTNPTNVVATFETNLTLSAMAFAPGETNGFPIYYQWQFNGTNIAGAIATNYSFMVTPDTAGNYSLVASNSAGTTNASWQVACTFIGSYIAPGTLAYYLSTNLDAYTNISTSIYGAEQPLADWTYAGYYGTNMYLMTNAVWSTNFWLKSVQGWSATPIGISNSLGAQTLLTMVSPRHYLRAHHIGVPPGMVGFLDTNNVIYWRAYVQQVQIGTSDTDVGILNADLPPSVSYLPVLPTNYMTYLPTNNLSYIQGIGMNQDPTIFGQPMLLEDPVVFWNSSSTAPFGLNTNWNVTIRGGDSSDPEMLVISNQLVLVSHNFEVGLGPNYAYQFDAINQQMHYLSTNNAVGSDYQLIQFSMTNWPAIQ